MYIVVFCYCFLLPFAIVKVDNNNQHFYYLDISVKITSSVIREWGMANIYISWYIL